MALQWTFLVAFLLGLILAVRYMIIGVEKASRSAPPGPPAVAAFRGPGESTAEYRTRVALPAIAGFASTTEVSAWRGGIAQYVRSSSVVAAGGTRV